MPLERLHRVQDRFDHCFVAGARVDHDVKVLTSGPVHSEMLFDKGCAILVDCLRQLDCFLLALAPLLEAANFLVEGSVDEDVIYIGEIAQVVCGASADDDTVAFLRRPPNKLFGNLANAVRIRQFQAGRV